MNSVFTAEKDIQGMREAGRLASEVLDHVAPHVKAGVSTAELDRICQGGHGNGLLHLFFWNCDF